MTDDMTDDSTTGDAPWPVAPVARYLQMADGTVILCSLCPACGSLPVLVLGGGRQAFCPNSECDALTWNPTHTARHNLDNGHEITVQERGTPVD